MGFSVLILAAGAGTRMKSQKPKVAHDILGKPLLRWVIDTAREAGADEVFTVLGHGLEATAPLAHDTTVVTQDALLDTGHALMLAQQTLEAREITTLVMLSGDTPLLKAETIRSLVAEHRAAGASVSLLTSSAEDSVDSIVEQEAFANTACFNTVHLFSILKQLRSGAEQSACSLADVVALIQGTGGSVVTTPANDPRELIDVNDRVQLAAATAEAQRRINTQHMLDGVSILDPTSAWIGPDVRLAADVEILPLTTLSGKTSVGWGSVIGPMSRVNNSTIGESCVVDDSVLIDSILEDRVSVGPRAYLRPGTIMRMGSRAGTHVEIKKSDIGPGSKVPHLSYIGDATLGENVNMGAGSITCNYDGSKKHPTVIGSRSFVGSDTMFVAPVTVGEGATIGAGSVITKDVPSESLALTRPEQVTIEGWTKRKGK